MRKLFAIVFVMSVLAGSVLALQAPNVTGQAVGQAGGWPAKYEVKITLHPGDPPISDFHIYWTATKWSPDQPSWNGPAGWNTTAGNNDVNPNGAHPGAGSKVDSVSFATNSPVTATTGPITLTFTLDPYSGSNNGPPSQPPARTPYWYATSDGLNGLPAAGAQAGSVEALGMINMIGHNGNPPQWNFPVW